MANYIHEIFRQGDKDQSIFCSKIVCFLEHMVMTSSNEENISNFENCESSIFNQFNNQQILKDECNDPTLIFVMKNLILLIFPTSHLKI